MQHVDEAELAAGRVNDIEASISGQNQVDIKVDIRAGGGPPVASVARLLALGPPLDHSGAQCRGGGYSGSTTLPLCIAVAEGNLEAV